MQKYVFSFFVLSSVDESVDQDFHQYYLDHLINSLKNGKINATTMAHGKQAQRYSGNSRTKWRIFEANRFKVNICHRIFIEQMTIIIS